MGRYSHTQLSAEAIAEAMEQELQKAHPNFGSDHATPTSRRVDFHYLKLRLHPRWTRERFRRLAAYMKLTPYELASIACIPHSLVDKWRPKSPMPVRAGADAMCLVLTILEHHVAGELVDSIPNPFPS